MKIIIQSALFFCILTVVTGIFYPGVITCLAQIFWPEQSYGSLLKNGENIIGSSLIGQKFNSSYYFWPRPSAGDYNAVPSSASNLGPTSALLKKLIATRRKLLGDAHNSQSESIPESLLLSSGSGLDPHILVDAALFQLERVAQARNLDKNSEEKIKGLIKAMSEKPWLHAEKDAFINVLELNIKLDQSFAKISR